MAQRNVHKTIMLGVVLSLCLPLTALAGARTHHRPHVSHHERHAFQHRQHGHRHDKPRHHAKPHHGVWFGVIVGGHGAAHHYPHGHHLHVHSPHCPVVVEPHVYHHTYRAPVWHVHHYVHHAYAPHSSIHIVVSADHGDMYVDGQYVGHGRQVRDGHLRVPVTPGKHLVQLRIGEHDVTRQVQVPSGATAVVESRLQR